jgi:hypothetical protein
MGPSRVPTPQLKADTLLVTAAQDLNDELTILLCAIELSSQEATPGSREAKTISEALGSIERCAWLAGSILRHQHARGLTGIAATTENLITEC